MTKKIYEVIDGYIYRVIKMKEEIPRHFRFIHENGDVRSFSIDNIKIPLIFISLHEAEIFALLHNITSSKIQECNEGMIYENGCFMINRE